MNTTNIEKYLNSFGKEVIKNAKVNLSKAGKGGGNLQNSLDFEVIADSKGFEVKFYMANYGEFVDKGVKGAGGIIKSGKHKGSYGGRRHYITWEGKRKDSPYRFGSGKGTGSIYKGIGAFIRKKGLQPRSEGGQFMTTAGLKIAIVKVLWVKGIHGISFFQKPLGLAWKTFGEGLLDNLGKDIVITLNKTKIR
tara:strand:+ start:147 stop:725 length:579 start_codon:yes stop_codon:yes gene_type:complete